MTSTTSEAAKGPQTISPQVKALPPALPRSPLRCPPRALASPWGLLRPGPLPPSRKGSGFTDLTLTRNLIPLILRGTLRRGHPPPSRGQGPRPGS